MGLIGQEEYLFPEGYTPTHAMKELYNKLLNEAGVDIDMKNPKWTEYPVNVSNLDSGQMTWESQDLETLISNLPKSHQSVLFVICDEVFASKTQERIQSLVGSLNRVPDYASGGTIKADVYTIISPLPSLYKIHHGLLTNYDNIEANGTISIRNVLSLAKQRWTMAAFAV